MAESTPDATRPADPAGRALFAISRALAVIGGLLACVVAVLVSVSVTGRYLFSAPIPGDYDVVGIISGCAVFCFLPYCQMIRGNVAVDFFTNGLPVRGKAALDAFGSLLYLVIAALFTWRLYHGAVELHDSNAVLAAFNFFRWWTVPLNIVCMAVLLATIAYSLLCDIRAASTGGGTARSTVSGD
jgi:TRAP-type C4-dicarboxylate transport system permease small subunit